MSQKKPCVASRLTSRFCDGRSERLFSGLSTNHSPTDLITDAGPSEQDDCRHYRQPESDQVNGAMNLQAHTIKRHHDKKRDRLPDRLLAAPASQGLSTMDKVVSDSFERSSHRSMITGQGKSGQPKTTEHNGLQSLLLP
jgi:hypothetical protein